MCVNQKHVKHHRDGRLQRGLYRRWVQSAAHLTVWILVFSACGKSEQDKAPVLNDQYGNLKPTKTEALAPEKGTPLASRKTLSPGELKAPTTETKVIDSDGSNRAAALPAKTQTDAKRVALAGPKPSAPAQKLDSKTASPPSSDAGTDEKLKQVKGALNQGRLNEAHQICLTRSRTESPEYKAACKAVKRTIFEHLEKALGAERASFSSTDNTARCRTLLKMVGEIAPLRVANVQALCSDLKASQSLGKAKLAIGRKLMDLTLIHPYECDFAKKEIAKLKTDFASTLQTEWNNTCGDFGGIYIAVFDKRWREARAKTDSSLKSFPCATTVLAKDKLDPKQYGYLVEICAEVKAEKVARTAIHAAREDIADSAPTVDYRCSQAAELLGALNTTWAAKRRTDLLTACDLQLGKVMVERYPKTKFLSCPWQLKAWFSQAAAHGRNVASIKALTESVRARCQGS